MCCSRSLQRWVQQPAQACLVLSTEQAPPPPSLWVLVPAALGQAAVGIRAFVVKLGAQAAVCSDKGSAED